LKHIYALCSNEFKNFLSTFDGKPCTNLPVFIENSYGSPLHIGCTLDFNEASLNSFARPKYVYRPCCWNKPPIDIFSTCYICDNGPLRHQQTAEKQHLIHRHDVSSISALLNLLAVRNGHLNNANDISNSY